MKAPRIPVKSLKAVIEYMKKEKEYLQHTDMYAMRKRVFDVLQPHGLNTTHCEFGGGLKGIYIEV